MIELIKALLPYIRPHWKKALGSVFFSFFLAGIKGAQVYLVRPVFDKGLNPNATLKETLVFAGILLGLGVLNFPVRFFHFYWIRFVVDRATCSIRMRVYDKFQRLPLSFFTAQKQGKLISNAMNDTMLLSQGFRSMVDLIREPLTAFVMLGLAIYRDWQLTLVIFLVAPLFILIFSKSGKKVRTHQLEVQEHLAHMTHSVSEGIMGQKVTKAFNLQNYVTERFYRAQEFYFKFLMKTTVVEEIAHPLVEFVGTIAFSLVLVFAHYRIASGEVSVGDFISFVAALALLMDPIRKYSQANVKMHGARAAGDRVFKLLNEPVEKDSGKLDLETFNSKIEINNVTFSYGDSDIIQNLSFTINKGEKVALVGQSGSGKSTMVNLLLRLYPIEHGEIKIDGVSIDDLSLKSLRDIFGYVGQDIFLFNDTIYENLTVGKTYTPEVISQALKVANATDFIEQSVNKMDTLIGDRGTKLSGGQCQRLTIARAFLQDAPILLFDEATSALDNESEKTVQESLDHLASDKTVLAVAHRLSTIQNYDKIIVLRDGKQVESGTHYELMKLKGEYAKLYELSQKS
jgi:subfamily B ATP-binding cassette protein MsbA